MKQLTESLYAIVVPEEATHPTMMDNELWWYIDSAGSHYKEDVGFDFTILGTVSQDTITFDVEPYVPFNVKMEVPKGITMGRLCNLLRKQKNEYNASFRSLLTSKGILIEENTKLVIIKKL